MTNTHPKIRVGILHSLTGTMALSERPLVDVALMAIDEINQAGGILGCELEPLLRDGGSDPEQFKYQVQQLIEVEQVTTVFGCWTSLSRKAVLPIFETHNVLLWYPLQYEGLEESPCVFYTGSCPNQQVEPALDWLLAQGKRRIYLVGSDYVFPRVANKIIKGQLKQAGGILVGEDYVPLGSQDFQATMAQLQQIQPDAIFNTLNGDSNLAFYGQFQAMGFTAAQLPIMAVSVAEAESQRIGTAAVGHYACWSYFQSLDSPGNQQFVEQFKQRYGADRVTSDPIEAAYSQVYLWRQAVITAGTVATNAVRQAAIHQSWQAPGGPVYCEANHHLHKECRIGQIQPDGQFQILSTSDRLLRPLPWLGVEAHFSGSQQVVIELLREVSQGVQYSWELEQRSQLLRQTARQLRQEVVQRHHAERALQIANAEILNLNRSLQADKSTLEQHVNARTQDLEAALQQLKAAQTQLIQTEKMSSLGQMVAGIAHEINNPINFVYGNLFHLQQYIQDFCELIELYQASYEPTEAIAAKTGEMELDFVLSDIHQLMSSMTVGIVRVREIVKAMRNFSRLDEADLKTVDLHEGLESTLLILNNRLKTDCTLVKQYGDLPLVQCYPAQINQVFTNILVNALDALEESDCPEPQITIITAAIADGQVQVTIQDNGPGIPEAIRQKIFDPFFTTKPVGKGTGLGLGICYQIVQKHAGQLDVSSEPGQGTEFRITLPVLLPSLFLGDREQGSGE
ncbi:MAG: transporter substrate-binding protein [Cyanobacteria bacterium P01_G01_bin.54]